MLATKEQNAFKEIFKSTFDQGKITVIIEKCRAEIAKYETTYKRFFESGIDLPADLRGLVFNSHSRSEMAREILKILK